jgi:hypothetical protein
MVDKDKPAVGHHQTKDAGSEKPGPEGPRAAAPPDFQPLKLFEEHSLAAKTKASQLTEASQEANSRHVNDHSTFGAIFEDMANTRIRDGKPTIVEKQKDGGVSETPLFNSDDLYKDAQGNTQRTRYDGNFISGPTGVNSTTTSLRDGTSVKETTADGRTVITAKNGDSLVIQKDGSEKANMGGKIYIKPENGTWKIES